MLVNILKQTLLSFPLAHQNFSSTSGKNYVVQCYTSPWWTINVVWDWVTQLHCCLWILSECTFQTMSNLCGCRWIRHFPYLEVIKLLWWHGCGICTAPYESSSDMFGESWVNSVVVRAKYVTSPVMLQPLSNELSYLMATKSTFNIRHDGSSFDSTSSGDFKGKYIFRYVSIKQNCSKELMRSQ